MTTDNNTCHRIKKFCWRSNPKSPGLLFWVFYTLEEQSLQQYTFCTKGLQFNRNWHKHFSAHCELQKYASIPSLQRHCFILSHTFTFMHLADAFIQSDLQLHSGYTLTVSTCVPWESNPQPFALLTQCSTTEPHRNTYICSRLCVYERFDKSL